MSNANTHNTAGEQPTKKKIIKISYGTTLMRPNNTTLLIFISDE